MKQTPRPGNPSRALLYSGLALALLTAAPAVADTGSCGAAPGPGQRPADLACLQLEEVTIFGKRIEVRDVAGGASLVSAEDLEIFQPTDVVRAMRQVPGVSFQVEDGYGLRPNLSIRGTATERSSRVTLMEDGVLIAPAPYTAPSAYYFPTFGRVHEIEVLKGPASITQGPYTVGGAVNLISTPIPDERRGLLRGEYGSDATGRLHGWYGGQEGQWGYLVETHQWQSDGFQFIDRSDSDTGFDKEDYLAKLRWESDRSGSVRHTLGLKLVASEEQSRQSYLGLTDADFRGAPLRRYGLSALDVMDNEFRSITGAWEMELESGLALTVTAYNHDFERAWYKTEGIDFDGSEDAQPFGRTSWARVVDAVNRGNDLGGFTPEQLQAILAGADTAPGSIQLRNNSREYYSRGVQLELGHRLEFGGATHSLQAGLRLHEDEEDRLQRNDAYQQLGGELVLSDRGLEGNAGNRVQDAQAWAVYVHDRIEWNRWTLTPGLRYESIDLSRVNFGTDEDPGSRDPASASGQRENNVDVWIPGIGALYDVNDRLRLVAGVHRGFAVPGNQPGVDPEESTNWELGLRWSGEVVQLDLMGFLNDYENLVGVCTNSSGSDCDPGDAFNGDAVEIPGIELALAAELSAGNDWYFPLRLSYTWMDAEFQTDFDSDFFGEVRAGDPVPYVPDQQALASAGAIYGDFSANLSANYVADVCTQASCDAFQRTESATLWDLALRYRIHRSWEIYAIAENLTDELYVAGREPYGARPNKARTYLAGVRFDF